MRIKPNIPIAIQAANMLRRRLRQDYVNGGRIPSENILAEELGISRGTIRQALAILQQEGVISRQQGAGTFANQHVLGINARIDLAYEFTQLIEAAGHQGAIDTVEVKRESATAEVANRLGIERGASVLVIRKLFLADGQRAIYVIEHLPESLIREAFEENELSGPIFVFFQKRCHVTVDYILSEVIPCVADSALETMLDVAIGQPLLKFDEVFYSVNNQPLAQATVFFQSSLIRFHALRKMSAQL